MLFKWKKVIFQRYDDKKKKGEKQIFFISNFDKNINEIRNEYNIYTKGVDEMNQFISYYNIERRSKKWWKKLFFLQ